MNSKNILAQHNDVERLSQTMKSYVKNSIQILEGISNKRTDFKEVFGGKIYSSRTLIADQV